MQVQENYRGQPMAANASIKIGGARISGFLATVTGTLTVTDADSTVTVNTLPVTAGVYTPLPLFFNTSMGGTVALAGGAAGTLFL
jgi:hypothetical protein